MLSNEYLAAERRVVEMCRQEMAANGSINADAVNDEDRMVRDGRAKAMAVGFMENELAGDPDFAYLISSDRDAIADAAVKDLYYLGPLEELLFDRDVTEVMVNGPEDVWVERSGLLSKTQVQFADDEHVKFVIDRIASGDGRRCDEAAPLCDCTLKRPGAPFDGSRVNAVCKGIGVDHHLLDIRKFKEDAMGPEDLMAVGSFDQRAMDLMQTLVTGRMNIIVSGGTGTGKTTMLNALSSFIPDGDRIITIEDTAELKLQKSQVVRMQSRPANTEGEGEITIRQLVVNALRQRPDRIVVGECRSAEAFDMVQAMSTGHDGSLTTVHANNSKETLTRLQSMIQQTGIDMPVKSIMELVTQSVDFIVSVKRYPDGSRRLTEICEVCGMEGEVPVTAPIIQFKQDVFDGGKVTGRLISTGNRPTSAHMDRLRAAGAYVDDSWFVAEDGVYGGY